MRGRRRKEVGQVGAMGGGGAEKKAQVWRRMRQEGCMSCHGVL